MPGCRSDKANPHGFSFFKDNTMHNPRSMKRIGGACFDPSLVLSDKVFAASNDGKTIFCGGHWDGSVGVFFISKAKIIQVLHRHLDVVTCLAVDGADSLLMSGSKDTTCILWAIGPANSSANGPGVASVVGVGVGGTYPPAGSLEVDPRPLFTFYGHDAPVTCVSLCAELDMAMSGSEDGTVNIHSIQDGCFMLSLIPPTYANMCGPEVSLLAMSSMGYIAVYFEEKTGTNRHLDIYSVNGKHLFAHRPQHPILSMVGRGDHLLTGDIAGMLSIREIHGLALLSMMTLEAPMTSMSFAPGATHLLASLTDGNVAVINAQFFSSS
ncbi:unnamed protein product [Notodromas monacha]|uniref:Neurobeachin beta-propeller domain-containing protein n=1 Tax=Notodromas monacha TaxID=399045 RepID=A0A7R9BUT6_9CRUS|nr:unnamed protein product [Notodromas monacha]CAG0920537.1 unnamed protein product [Notodromas monacha]